ncbi:MerR family transcriptional regulator [Oscillospiraceae bacterium OttesenSCG-928-F05]|nr:MerR family transcriptional regulator [Oscillospiraceae bacterium OttesenSCG-928-F05]
MAKNLLRISQFARLAGMDRQRLIFYDRIGLLSPDRTDPQTGYRYYAYPQIDTANVIWALRETGMSLGDIKAYLDSRSPEALVGAFSERRHDIDRQILRLTRIRRMIDARIQLTEEARTVAIGEVQLISTPAKPLFLGHEIPPITDSEEEWEYLPAFYDLCDAYELPTGLPVGTLVRAEQIHARQWRQPSRYYYHLLPDVPSPLCGERPEGLYAVGCDLADYGAYEPLYTRLFQFIDAQHLTIAGGAYEDYLLDEIATPNPENYLVRIAIQVRRKPQ